MSIFRKNSKLSKEIAAPTEVPAITTAAEVTKILARARAMLFEHVGTDAVHTNPRNARKHSAQQNELLLKSIQKYGLTKPIAVDENYQILAGENTYLALKKLGVPEIPVVRHLGLTPHDKRAVALADNRIAELAKWDEDKLHFELRDLSDPSTELSFDLGVLGFASFEADAIVEPPPESREEVMEASEQDLPPVTRPGDKWICGGHSIVCANPMDLTGYELLLQGEQASVAFANTPSAEFDPDSAPQEIRETCERLKAHVAPGGLIYYLIGSYQLGAFFQASEPVLGSPKDMIVWLNSTDGAGTYYRARYQHVAVFTVGDVAAIHGSQLTRRGQHRTNVWDHSRRHGRRSATPVGVALVMDILRDCTRRDDIILAPFAGLGSILIAAERVGRRARVIEEDPNTCDSVIRKWEKFARSSARLAESSETFAQVADRRSAEKP